jgi:hypothetical protein
MGVRTAAALATDKVTALAPRRVITEIGRGSGRCYLLEFEECWLKGVVGHQSWQRKESAVWDA